ATINVPSAWIGEEVEVVDVDNLIVVICDFRALDNSLTDSLQHKMNLPTWVGNRLHCPWIDKRLSCLRINQRTCFVPINLRQTRHWIDNRYLNRLLAGNFLFLVPPANTHNTCRKHQHARHEIIEHGCEVVQVKLIVNKP